MVVSGLTLMSSPWWIEIVKKTLATHYNLHLGTQINPEWGFYLCFMALLYHLLCTGAFELAKAFNQRSLVTHKLDHDREVYSGLNGILSESQLLNTLNWLGGDHCLYSDQQQQILNFHDTLISSNLAFINADINLKSLELANKLLELIKIFRRDFDMFPYDQTVLNYRLCLAPQLNCDRAGEWEDGLEYSKLEKKMLKAIQDIEEAYRDWRQSVKQNAFV